MKRPLIFNFFEQSSEEILPDKGEFDYDDELQLSVVKGTKISAFDVVNLSTYTMTKAGGEVTDDDSEAGGIRRSDLGTITFSAINDETTDSDADKTRLQNVLSTRTMTLSHEATDSDR